MIEMASQITSLAIVYPIVYSDADQRKHQSSASLAFVRRIHRGPVNSPHKWPVTRKMFPFDDVIMETAGAFDMAWIVWYHRRIIVWGCYIFLSKAGRVILYETWCRNVFITSLLRAGEWIDKTMDRIQWHMKSKPWVSWNADACYPTSIPIAIHVYQRGQSMAYTSCILHESCRGCIR